MDEKQKKGCRETIIDKMVDAVAKKKFFLRKHDELKNEHDRRSWINVWIIHLSFFKCRTHALNLTFQ